MNVSHSARWIWWAPGRCGTRSVCSFLKYYGFSEHPTDMHIAYPGKADGYTHNIGIPPGCDGYMVAMQVRNPYSRLVSMWRLECMSDLPGTVAPTMPFREFATTRLSTDLVTALEVRRPDHLIRLESLAADVAALPFVDLGDPAVRALYDEHIMSNGYSADSVDRAWDWRSHYDDALAQVVYDNNRAVFDAFGYDRDSWEVGR